MSQHKTLRSQNTGRTTIKNIVNGSRPARSFERYIEEVGTLEAMENLDEYLGDLPSGNRIRKGAVALSRSESELREDAESPHSSTRRVARLFLLEAGIGVSDDPILQKGLSDPVGRIRSDAARLVGAGSDRTRLYNQLVRLIREDPDSKVRNAAGKRLSLSFADLYAIDFDGLPELSRMLILDALDGHTRIDEQRAESILMTAAESGNSEASFRAALRLSEWGTLRRYFDSEKKTEPVQLLDIAASLGVVNYLEKPPIPDSRRERAFDLSKKAGREHLCLRFAEKKIAGPETSPAMENSTNRFSYTKTEVLLETLYERLSNNFIGGQIKVLDNKAVFMEIESLPLDDPKLKSAIETVLPSKRQDVLGIPALMIAEKAQWKDWLERALFSLNAEEPNLRVAAISCVAAIAGRDTVKYLEPMLRDPIYRVRYQAALSLSLRSSEQTKSAQTALADTLTDCLPDTDECLPIIRALKDSGSPIMGEIIVSCADGLSTSAIAKILSHGISEESIEVLLDTSVGIGMNENAELATEPAVEPVGPTLNAAWKDAGPSAGESLLRAWGATPDSGRKQLIEWTIATGWPALALEQFSARDKAQNARITRLIHDLSRVEREALFAEDLSGADAKIRRLAKKLISRKTTRKK